MAVARGSEVRNIKINLRAPAQVKEMIDCAARLLGKSRSEFMLDSARKYAVDVLLDQRFFLLDEELHADLLESLSEPRKPSAQLRKLLASESPWER